MIRNLNYFFILVASFSPVAWMISEYNSKSIFLPPGVIFSIIGFVLLFSKISSNQRVYLNYSILFAFLIISFFISIFSYSLSIGHISYVPFFSVVKYLYPMFSFYFFMHAFRNVDSVSPLFYANCCVVAVLFFSDFIFGRFPSPRWGGNFLGLDTYGHPNSFAILALMYLSVFMALYKHLSLSLRITSIFLIVYLCFLMPMTLSRNAFFSLLLFFLFYLALRFSTKSFLFASLLGALSCILSYYDFFNLHQLFNKFNRMLENGIFYGRSKIWHDLIDPLSNNPIFGHGFTSISTFTDKGTAHNQYLELLFKSGFIGLFAYSFVWILIALYFKKISKTVSSFYFLYVFFLVILFSNLAQPNLSYSSLQFSLLALFSYIYNFTKNLKVNFYETNSSRYGQR